MNEFFKDKKWDFSLKKVESFSDVEYGFLTGIIEELNNKPYLKPLCFFLGDIQIEDFYILVHDIESPMEYYFVVAWYLYADTDKYSIYSQWEIESNSGKKYRSDFHIVNDKEDGWGEPGNDTPLRALLVEIDGHEYHSTKEQKARDSKRDREIISEGYKIMRFTGSEVFRDAKACVEEVVKYLEGIK